MMMSSFHVFLNTWEMRLTSPSLAETPEKIREHNENGRMLIIPTWRECVYMLKIHFKCIHIFG